MIRIRLFATAIALSLAGIVTTLAFAQSPTEMVRITQRTELTDEVYRGVTQGLNLLPLDVRRGFTAGGVTVTITPSLAAFGDANGKGTEYSPRLHTVIICERNKDGTPSDMRRMPITVLHELGHAFDQLLGYPSRTAAFRDIYRREAARVDEHYHQPLAYFIDDPATGPRECFASLFACKYFRARDNRLDALRISFPDSYRFVEQLRLPETHRE